MKHAFSLPTLVGNVLGVTAGIVPRQANGGSTQCCFHIAVVPNPTFNSVVNSTGWLGFLYDDIATGPDVAAEEWCYENCNLRAQSEFGYVNFSPGPIFSLQSNQTNGTSFAVGPTGLIIAGGNILELSSCWNGSPDGYSYLSGEPRLGETCAPVSLSAVGPACATSLASCSTSAQKVPFTTYDYYLSGSVTATATTTVTAPASTVTVSVGDCGPSYATSAIVGASAAPATTPDVTSVTAAATPTVIVGGALTTDVSAPISIETPTSTSAASAADACYTPGPNFQFPHLIVPVNGSAPDTAYGTVYSPTLSPNVQTIYNFDIPASYAGMTCDLIWAKPALSQLTTSSYTESGAPGGLIIYQLDSPATLETTWNTRFALLRADGFAADGTTVSALSGPCAAGTTVAYRLTSSFQGDYSLQYFQDYNPCAIGLYIDAHY